MPRLTNYNKNGLTPKEQIFADEVLRIGNYTEAYRKVNPYAKDATCRAAGTKWANKPNVVAYLEKVRQQQSDNAIADVFEIKRYLTAVMRGEVPDQFGLDASLSDRTAAAKELIKRIDVEERAKERANGNITTIRLIRGEEKCSN